MRSRFLTNAAANYAGQLTVVAIGFLLTPALLFHLGTAMYGVLMVVSAVQGLAGLFDFGMATSVVRYVAEHKARDEAVEINRVVSSSFFVYLAVGALAFVVIVGVAIFGLPLLSIESNDLPVAQQALLIAGISLLLGLPIGVFSSLLLGLRHYEWANAINILQAVVAAGVTLLVLEAGGGPRELVLVNTVSLLLAYALKALLAFRLLPTLRLSLSLGNRMTLRRIGGYSSWIFALDVAKRIFYNADAVLIAAFLPVTQVTAYNLGFKPASAISYLSGPFVSVLLPAASAMEALNEQGQLKRLLRVGTRLALVLTLPAMLWLLVFGRQVLELWVGPGHEEALPVLYLFLGVFLVSAIQNPSAVILQGIGQVRLLALAVIAEYVANLVLSIILLPRVGLVGAALGTLIPAFVVDVFLIPWLVCRALKISYGHFVFGTLMGPLLSVVPAWALLALVSRQLQSPSLLEVGAGAMLALLLFGIFFLIIGADRQEKGMLWHALRAGRARLERTTNKKTPYETNSDHRNTDQKPAGGAAPDAGQPSPSESGPGQL